MDWLALLVGAALACSPFLLLAAVMLRFMPMGGASTHYGGCRCRVCRRMGRG